MPFLSHSVLWKPKRSSYRNCRQRFSQIAQSNTLCELRCNDCSRETRVYVPHGECYRFTPSARLSTLLSSGSVPRPFMSCPARASYARYRTPHPPCPAFPFFSPQRQHTAARRERAPEPRRETRGCPHFSAFSSVRSTG